MEATKRILIVAQHEATAKLLLQTLTAKGYQVLVAANVGEGLLTALTFWPHLVILDLAMAGVTSQAFLDAWKHQKTPKLTVPIIVLNTLNEEQATTLHVEFCLSSPFNLDELFECVELSIGVSQFP
jgi:DNA-binding response OmpR family regulator